MFQIPGANSLSRILPDITDHFLSNQGIAFNENVSWQGGSEQIHQNRAQQLLAAVLCCFISVKFSTLKSLTLSGEVTIYPTALVLHIK